MYRVVTPQTPAELDASYPLRREALLRKPFNLPVGSERDEYDTVAIHRLMLSPDGTPIAVGRLFVGGGQERLARRRALAADGLVTGGGVQEPSSSEGGVSVGQYSRSIRTNLPAGAGSQLDSLSGPGLSAWM